MPLADYAVHATWTAPLAPGADELLLERLPSGTVVSHPAAAAATTVVAIPVTAAGVRDVARTLDSWLLALEVLVGAVPFSISVDPIDPD